MSVAAYSRLKIAFPEKNFMKRMVRMAKNKNNPIAVLKRILSMALVSALLVASSAINFGASAAEGDTEDDGVGAVVVADHTYAPYFGQTVYLKPDTQYTFSYKYTTDAADAAIMNYYSQGNNEGTAFPEKSEAVYDTYYNMVTYTFKTVSLDTEGVILNDSGELIKSYIGIRVWNSTKYDFYDYVFADFQLLENGTGTNCFANPTFDSMQESAGDEEALWGAIDRSSDGWIANLCYPRYYVDGVNPQRSYFVSTPKDEAIKVKAVASVPYFIQKVWLKPSTSYVFSYYYSEKEADSFSCLLTNGEKPAYTESSLKKSYDTAWNKVTYEFTTVGTDDTNAVYNEDKTLLQAVIGMRNYSTSLIDTYFAGFDLYEAGDNTKTNLLSDTKFKSIGSFDNGNVWGTYWGPVSMSDSYVRASADDNLTDDDFKRINEISIESSLYGYVTASTETVTYGQTVTLNVVPDEGYELLELNASGKPVPCVNGEYRFDYSNYYSDPTAGGKVNISATFIKENTIPAITNTTETFARAIAQKMWLEPNTVYVFSYHYDSAPASGVRVGYTDKSGTSANIDIADEYIEEINIIEENVPGAYEYKTKAYRFMTPSLNAENVVVGDGQNEGLVECAVGLLFADEGGAHLFGGLNCYKADDPYKTNMFTERDFANLSTHNQWSKEWKSYYTGTEPFQICTRYDADTTTTSVDNPSADLFRKGDCNDDGNIDILDFIRMKKYIADNNTEIVLGNADMTGCIGYDSSDIVIDSSDLAILKQLLLGVNK